MQSPCENLNSIDTGNDMVSVQELLETYARRWPDETSTIDFLHFLAITPHAFERENVAGHFTGSAWLVSEDGERVLLMHHRKLGRWLQPGGHADGDSDLARVALREAHEETGLESLQVEAGVFDLDRHRIPARGNETEHWHYDVRFVVRAIGSERFVLNEESMALAWTPICTIASDASADMSLRRMAIKWLARQHGSDYA